MLAAASTPSRIALNRTTFGARDIDVAAVDSMGWVAWVDAQLSPPVGDDPHLAQFIDSQRLHYVYPAMTFGTKSWAAVDEQRPLNYMKANVELLYALARGPAANFTFGEQVWPHIEHCSAIYIRNTLSKFQLREFMVDFWFNHFNMHHQKATVIANTLVAFDRDVVRPNVFGNFRMLLEAVAKSPAMLVYLDNVDSTAALPNENYARELMELHTLGEAVYLGKTAVTGPEAAQGFTDADVLQAARAFSGWTMERAQGNGIPDTGRFIYNEAQHNKQAGVCLGFDLATLQGEAQGQRVLDLLAGHPATARFMCFKICRRIFGDAPPIAVIDRAIAAWVAHSNKPNQIAQVLRAILVDGPEVTETPVTKVRRPYERIVALWRATDTVVNADRYWVQMMGDINDAPFVWPTPNGRPDVNSFWLNTFVNVSTWQYMQDALTQMGVRASLHDQTPLEALGSVVATVDYWVGRIIGYELSPDAMNALYKYAESLLYFGYGNTTWSPDEITLRKIAAAIAMAPEFTVR